MTNSLDAFRGLPVAELALPRTHLHLRATTSFLPEAFSIIRGWGFTFKSCFVWVKPVIERRLFDLDVPALDTEADHLQLRPPSGGESGGEV